jgi:hypothetical protein
MTLSNIYLRHMRHTILLAQQCHAYTTHGPKQRHLAKILDERRLTLQL